MGFLQQALESDLFSFEEKKQQNYRFYFFRSQKKQRRLNEVQIHENKSYDDLIQRIKFKEFNNYPNPHFQPGIKFLKFLAKKPTGKELNKFSLLKLWIPDTIVYEQGIDPFWIYSGFDGLVYRTEKFYDKTVVSKLGNKYQLNELSAIIKYEDFDDGGNPNGNQVVLQSTKDLAIKIANKKSESESMVIQRFIKCKGSNAFICRAHWRRTKAATCFIITNKLPFHDRDESQWQPGTEYERYVTNQAQRFACSIIESKGNSTYQEPVMMAENIAKYVEKNTGARFSDFVADFIKDEFGIWWLANVKAFALEDPSLKLMNLKSYTGINDVVIDSDSENEEKAQADKFEKEGLDLFQKMSICKFCQLGFNLASLRHKLTLKQIINTEKYIKDIGFNKDWLAHGDMPSSIDPFVLYQPQSVCKDCYSLHKQVQRLKVAHQEFAAVFGIEVKDADGTAIQGDNERDLMDPDKMIDYIIEKHFSQPPDFGKGSKSEPEVNPKSSVVEPAKDVMSIPNLFRYKVLIIVYELCEISPIPKGYCKDLNLEYRLLNREFKTKLNCSQSFNSDIDMIPVNSMQLYHFFADDADKPIRLLEQEKRLTIEFKTPQGKVVGRVNLSMNDFKSPLVNQKQFYQLVTFDKFIGYLRCAICWDAGQERVDVKALKLAMHENITGIYYPPNEYCACDGLPDEWIRLIPNIKDQQRTMQQKLLSYRMNLDPLSGSRTQYMSDDEPKSGAKKYSASGKRKGETQRQQMSQSPVSPSKRYDQVIVEQVEIKSKKKNQDTSGFFSSRKEKISNFGQKKKRPKTSVQPVNSRMGRELSEHKAQKFKNSIVEQHSVNKQRPKSKYMESTLQTSTAQLSHTYDRPTTAGTMSSKLLLRKQASMANLKQRNMNTIFKQQHPFVQSQKQLPTINQVIDQVTSNSGFQDFKQPRTNITRLLESTQQLKKQYSVLNEKGLDKFLNQKILENAIGKKEL